MDPFANYGDRVKVDDWEEGKNNNWKEGEVWAN
jgi:hypothetical protein